MKSVYISPDKLKPESIDDDILIKIKNPNTIEQKNYLYTVGYYSNSNDSWYTADGDKLPTDLIVGWVYIPE